jgi:septum formation protein
MSSFSSAVANMNFSKLVLASASPRRSEILSNAALKYEVLPTDIDERSLPNESPEKMVRRLAEAKSRAAYDMIYCAGAAPAMRGLPILGADTVVALGTEILGKPADAKNAKYMLERLSGKVHEVLTGVAILFPGAAEDTVLDVRVALTKVEFRILSSKQIEEYINSGEPFDKAGAYGIQGLASKYVKRIEGCYFNVVGLPIALVSEMLEEHFANRDT